MPKAKRSRGKDTSTIVKTAAGEKGGAPTEKMTAKQLRKRMENLKKMGAAIMNGTYKNDESDDAEIARQEPNADAPPHQPVLDADQVIALDADGVIRVGDSPAPPQDLLEDPQALEAATIESALSVAAMRRHLAHAPIPSAAASISPEASSGSDSDDDQRMGAAASNAAGMGSVPDTEDVGLAVHMAAKGAARASSDRYEQVAPVDHDDDDDDMNELVEAFLVEPISAEEEEAQPRRFNSSQAFASGLDWAGPSRPPGLSDPQGLPPGLDPIGARLDVMGDVAPSGVGWHASNLEASMLQDAKMAEVQPAALSDEEALRMALQQSSEMSSARYPPGGLDHAAGMGLDHGGMDFAGALSGALPTALPGSSKAIKQPDVKPSAMKPESATLAKPPRPVAANALVLPTPVDKPAAAAKKAAVVPKPAEKPMPAAKPKAEVRIPKPRPTLTEVLQQLEETLACPISYEVMKDPVILCGDGNTYDRSSITEWLKTHKTSPMTNEPVSDTTLVPNKLVKSLIEELNEHNGFTSGLNPCAGGGSQKR